MASSDPTMAPTSRALLRIVAQLAVLLLEDPTAKRLARIADEVDEVLEDVRGLLSSDIVSLLRSAHSTLSSASPSSAFSAGITALSSLSRAAELLATSAFPPSPPPFSRLPAEVVSRIVEFSQSDNVRKRQNTNIALASTCRALYHAVRPVLEREMHLFTARQLERAAASIRSKERDADALRVFTAELAIADIELQPDGSWPGRRLLPLITALNHLEVLHLRLRPTMGATLTSPGAMDALSPIGWDIGDDQEWVQASRKPTVRDMLLPSVERDGGDEQLSRIFFAPSTLESLAIGNSNEPANFPVEDIWRARHEVETHPDLVENSLTPSSLKVLKIPWYRVALDDLFSLVGPTEDIPSKPPCRLEHLEVLLATDGDVDTRISTIQAFFAALKTTIRHLVLRIVPEDATLSNAEQYRFTAELCASLSTCDSLEYLEMGGIDLWGDWPIFLAETHPPNLRHLTLLPIPNENHGLSGMIDYAYDRPASMRSVTVCVPSLSGGQGVDEWAGDLERFRGSLQVMEEHGIEVRVEVRETEGKWWAERVAEW